MIEYNATMKIDPMDYSGFSAESFAEFLSEETGYKVGVARPVNYFQLATKVFLAVGAAAVLKLAYRYFAFIIYHKTTWTIISILIILTMTSGHMWNRIRTPPFLMPGKNGEINYIQSG
jgi:oligosaccharyltransferase complex subunit gamma